MGNVSLQTVAFPIVVL